MEPEVIAAFIAAGAACLTLLLQMLFFGRMKRFEANINERSIKRAKAFEEELAALNDFYDTYQQFFYYTFNKVVHGIDTRDMPDIDTSLLRFQKCIRNSRLTNQAQVIISNVKEFLWVGMKASNDQYRRAMNGHTSFIEDLKHYRNKLME